MSAAIRSIRAALLVALLAACAEDVTQSGAGSNPPPTGQGMAPAGLLKVTISGISGSHPAVSVAPVPVPGGSAGAEQGIVPARAAAVRMDARLTPMPPQALQLKPLSTESFMFGTRGGGGYRYVSATFRVRNAGTDEIAYTDLHENVTLMAIGGDGAIETINFTAFTELKRFDGSNASFGIAQDIVPTGGVTVDPSTGTVVGDVPDVVQFFTESDVAPLNALFDDHLTVLPYGFVVRSRTSGSDRVLAANPAADDFAGLVTIAFRIPLQATAAQDPYTVSILMKPVTDGDRVVSQSLEESNNTGRRGILARAQGLGPTSIVSLVGERFPGFSTTQICSVRIAGDESVPLKSFNGGVHSYAWTPTPFVAGANAIAANAAFSATFCQAMAVGSAATYQVSGAKSGLQFTAGGYSGGVTPIVSTGAGAFFPGEQVTVRITHALLSGVATPAEPRTHTYFVAAAGGTGALVEAPGSPLNIGAVQGGVVRLGDFDHDGKLDLLSAPFGAGVIKVFHGGGDGTFAPLPDPGVSFDQYYTAELVDMNNDGDLDIVAFGSNLGTIQVLLGDGAGGFTSTGGVSVPGQVYGAVGDINGDGKMDVASSRSGSHEIRFLFGDGTGALTGGGTPITNITGWMSAPTLADFDDDGRLDLAVVANDGLLRVYLQDPGGRFLPSFETNAAADGFSFPAADLDGDGNLDLVTPSSTNVVTRWYGTGVGTFTSSPPCDVGKYSPWSIALGDMNGDGRLDIVAAHYAGGGGISIVLQNTDGSCAGVQTVDTFNSAIGIDVGDLDGDGALDAVSASINGPTPSPGVASVFLNTN